MKTDYIGRQNSLLSKQQMVQLKVDKFLCSGLTRYMRVMQEAASKFGLAKKAQSSFFSYKDQTLRILELWLSTFEKSTLEMKLETELELAILLCSVSKSETNSVDSLLQMLSQNKLNGWTSGVVKSLINERVNLFGFK